MFRAKKKNNVSLLLQDEDVFLLQRSQKDSCLSTNIYNRLPQDH